MRCMHKQYIGLWPSSLRLGELVNLKLAKWRSDPIDGMNDCGIKMVDNTLR